MSESTVSLFQFDVDVFEKADAGESKARRIGGYASTEKLDRQGEVLVQKGLDFSECLQYGWFNDNHMKNTQDVLGYPTSAVFHEGKGWKVEGYLLKGYEPADKIWNLAKSLQGTDRKLGFSVEGKVTLRKSNRILKARITHIAITHVPVNPECTIDVLAKSLCTFGDSAECKHCDKTCMEKALAAGYGTSPETKVGGAALVQESLDRELKDLGFHDSEGGGVAQIQFLVAKGYSPEFSVKVVKALQSGQALHTIMRKRGMI